jgi:hypothetical protein
MISAVLVSSIVVHMSRGTFLLPMRAHDGQAAIFVRVGDLGRRNRVAQGLGYAYGQVRIRDFLLWASVF